MGCKLLVVIFLITSSLSCSKYRIDNSVIAENGVLNLTGIDLEKTNGVKLDGEWEFYWNNFVTFNKEGATVSVAPEHVELPGSWADTTNHESQGFGTFRLKVYGLEPDTIFSLYIPVITTSYDIWINGHLVVKSGVVGESSADSAPESLINTVSFYSRSSAADIVIHTSNYHYRKGSINRSIILGSVDSFKFRRIRTLMLDMFLVGLLFSMAFFRIKISYSRIDNSRIDLDFALICISLAMLIMTRGEQPLGILLPIVPWIIIKYLEIVFFYLVAPIFMLMLSELYPEEVHKSIHKVFSILTLLACLLFIFLPRDITDNVRQYNNGLIVAFLIYVFYVFIRAIKNRRINAIFYTLSTFGVSLTTLSYVLSTNNIYVPYISSVGFFILIFFQSDMLTTRFSKTFKQREMLVKSRDKFKYASLTDGLTGLYNVRYLNTFLEENISSVEVKDSTLSVIMLDVDNFKNYNDTYGHKEGDVVLKELATVIKRSARDVDAPCRYGGEEFILILPGAHIAVAEVVAERIRLKFESLGYSTISVGISELLPGENGDQVIKRADMALYKAKNSGKNRIVLWG